MPQEIPLQATFEKLADSHFFQGKKPKSLHDRGLDDNTPLHVAVLLKDLEAAKILLQAGANPNASGQNGNTPLHIAVEDKNYHIVQLLLSYAASKDRKNDSDLSPNDFVQRLNDAKLKEAFSLWPKGGLAPKVSDLLNKIQENSLDMLGVKVNEINARGILGDTPLHTAVGWGINEVRILLEAGANPNLPGEYDFTPLHHAVKSGNYDMVKLLLEHGASKDFVNEWGFTPADYAKKSGDSRLVEIFS
ncbi:MAG TPA: ankyrin repeat domain-containing protein [Verrucomicrobiae bacterium]|nr:ankyrin repeat domain-containing protein [Verrucomicrobiae bacterium]